MNQPIQKQHDKASPSLQELYDDISAKNASGAVDFGSVFKNLDMTPSVAKEIEKKSKFAKIVSGYGETIAAGLSVIPGVGSALSGGLMVFNAVTKGVTVCADLTDVALTPIQHYKSKALPSKTEIAKGVATLVGAAALVASTVGLGGVIVVGVAHAVRSITSSVKILLKERHQKKEVARLDGEIQSLQEDMSKNPSSMTVGKVQQYAEMVSEKNKIQKDLSSELKQGINKLKIGCNGLILAATVTSLAFPPAIPICLGVAIAATATKIIANNVPFFKGLFAKARALITGKPPESDVAKEDALDAHQEQAKKAEVVESAKAAQELPNESQAALSETPAHAKAELPPGVVMASVSNTHTLPPEDAHLAVCADMRAVESLAQEKSGALCSAPAAEEEQQEEQQHEATSSFASSA